MRPFLLAGAILVQVGAQTDVYDVDYGFVGSESSSYDYLDSADAPPVPDLCPAIDCASCLATQGCTWSVDTDSGSCDVTCNTDECYSGGSTCPLGDYYGYDYGFVGSESTSYDYIASADVELPPMPPPKLEAVVPRDERDTRPVSRDTRPISRDTRPVSGEKDERDTRPISREKDERDTRPISGDRFKTRPVSSDPMDRNKRPATRGEISNARDKRGPVREEREPVREEREPVREESEPVREESEPVVAKETTTQRKCLSIPKSFKPSKCAAKVKTTIGFAVQKDKCVKVVSCPADKSKLKKNEKAKLLNTLKLCKTYLRTCTIKY